MRKIGRMWTYLLLSVGVLGMIVWAINPSGSAEDGLVSYSLYLGVATLGTVMAVLGIWQAPRSRRRIWIALAAGQVLYLAGDALYWVYGYFLHIAPYPSVADASYLSKYVAFAVALGWLARGRGQGRDRAAFLDAAIISTGFTVLAAVFLIAPAASAGGESLLSRLVAGAYPVGDVLLLAMLIRLFAGHASRSVAFVALATGSGVLLACDIYYTLTILAGRTMTRWIDLGYLSTYLLVGLCAMHPSSPALADTQQERDRPVTIGRIVVLGLSSIIAPALLIITAASGVRADYYVIGICAVAGSVLVLARLLDLLRRAEDQAAQLAALARNDSLTGIANRRSWDFELSRACTHARDSKAPLNVAVLDFDNFKAFNDTHGHLMGDRVLKETTAAWTIILGDQGFLARYGGEEFTVSIPGTSDTALDLLDRLMEAVTRGQTCSVGVASWNSVEDPIAVTARADQAMYHAKASGRNRIARHDERGRLFALPTPTQRQANTRPATPNEPTLIDAA
jgi:diguanylate cyclase (GGDEF)-like protein